MLEIGQKAPAFKLLDQYGNTRMLSDFSSGYLLLYFYPKDDTPGCTKEACTIKDSYAAFEKLGLSVVGISTDSVESHLKFAKKYNLPFTLLADTEKMVVQEYGTWGEKKFAGNVYQGTSRTSFLITPNGEIAKIYVGVTPATHAAEVISDLEKILS